VIAPRQSDAVGYRTFADLPAAPSAVPASALPRAPAERPAPAFDAGRARAAPTPLPRRPKGRWFFSLLLLAGCAALAGAAWQSLFRYTASGLLTARLVGVPSLEDGTLAEIAVRDGDRVEKDQVLFRVDNLILAQELARANAEVAVAETDLRRAEFERDEEIRKLRDE